MIHFHVAATGHSLNYLPQYVALEQGFFAENDLAVRISVPKPWDLVLQALREGNAQAALGGIWVPSMYFGRSTHFKAFAQLSNRAPLAVVGRERPEDFVWSNVQGKTVSMRGSNGASVGLFFKQVLRENQVDPRDVGFIQDLDGAMLAELFIGGMGDYLVIDYPGAMRMQAQGQGFVVNALAATGGDIPWSVYYDRVLPDAQAQARQQHIQARFVAALTRALHWLQAHEPEDYADFLVKTFPNLPRDLLVRAARDYKAWGMWRTTEIGRSAFERWQHGMVAGHIISTPIAYEDLVKTPE